MDTRTGMVVDEELVKRFLPAQVKNFVPVERDLTYREHMEQQIELYSPCGCGSGKQFKFCCKKSAQEG
jgi:uncharacterized protein YchJ